MSYLFDTDALSEVMRKRPLPRFLSWLRGNLRRDQFASAVSIAELYEGAHPSQHRDLLLRRIDEVVVPAHMTTWACAERPSRARRSS